MEISVTYRDITDEGLISFCQNNLTEEARYVLGIFQDTDGMKVDNEHYVTLVQLYFEVGAISEGEFDGTIHIEASFGDKTNTLM